MADEQNLPGDNAPPKPKLNLPSTGAPPRGAVPPIQIRAGEKKAETTRIDLKMATPPIATVGDTQQVQPDAEPAKPTIRVESAPKKTETQKVGPAALNTTMRVEVADSPKSKTTRIDIPAEAFQKAPGAPSRGQVPQGAEDVFKRTTIPVGIPTPPPTAAGKPKTISIKRPATAAAPAISPADKAVADAKKSETARIDLPADVGGERPATRPKTIRIKRPDGTSARKALTIARPDEAASAPEQRPLSIEGIEDEGEEIGSVFSVLTLVATIFVGILLYVLAAQSIAPNLPWPGRL
ncbi:MAG: hypothetical protein M5U15_13165 [Kiritimatiellae bacterium]|nr:hypothetical protein [Kiritimatiellia bacterium]